MALCSVCVRAREEGYSTTLLHRTLWQAIDSEVEEKNAPALSLSRPPAQWPGQLGAKKSSKSGPLCAAASACACASASTRLAKSREHSIGDLFIGSVASQLISRLSGAIE